MTPKEWGMESEELFRDARRALSPTATDRARVRERIAAKLAAGAVVASVAATTTKAAATTKTAFVAKIIAAVVLATGAATAVVVPRVFAKQEPVRAVVTAPPTKRAIARIAEKPRASQPAVILPAEVAPSPRPVAVRPPSSTAASVDEVALVAEIDGALRSRDAVRALALAADHERRFPKGLLVEEREGARVIARCMNGSRSGADAFLTAHPRSPMRARITAACGVRE
jgi:hypothetical protein